MPDSNPIQQLQQRLLELGCPAKAARKITRETAEHYEDLQKAALAQGLPNAEAATQAGKLLGEPRELAERHIEALRKSSWLARHPFLAFGFLPAAALLALGIVFWDLGGSRFISDDLLGFLSIKKSEGYVILKTAWVFPWMGFILWGSLLGVTAFVTFCLCRDAQRLAVARQWMWVTGGVLAAHGLFVQIQPSQWATLLRDVTVKEEKIVSETSTLGKRLNISEGMALRLNREDWSGPFVLYHASMNSLSSPEDNPDDVPSEVDVDMIRLVKLGEKVGPKYTLLQDPMLLAQITKSYAEIRNGQLHHPLTSLSGTVWQVLTTTKYDYLRGIKNRTFFSAIADGSGQLRWDGEVVVSLPLPAIFYSPAIYKGGWLHWFNVALPLLIVAAMLAWQRRGQMAAIEGEMQYA